MQLNGHLFFLVRNLRQHPFRTLASLSGVALATTILFLVTALALGIRDEIQPRIEAAFPRKEIIIQPKATDLAVLRFIPPTLTPEAIERIEKMAGVVAVSPVLPMRIPARGEVEMFGQVLSTDLVIYGVKPQLLAEDISHQRGFDYQENAPIPIIVSEHFLDLYNMGLAEANSMPKLTPMLIIGKQFDLVLGESTVLMGTEDTFERRRCMIVGLTKRSGLLGAMMPLEYTQRLNRAYSQDQRELFSQAVVEIRSIADYESVVQQLTADNFSLSGGVEVFRKVRGIIFGAWSVLVFLAASCLLLAFAGLFNAFSLMLHERQALIGLTRALGATQKCVRAMLLGEALIIGIVGGLFGCMVGGLLGWAINANLEQLFPDLLLLPKTIFITGWQTWLLGFTLPVGGALLTPLALVYRATSRAPSLLLGEV